MVPAWLAHAWLKSTAVVWVSDPPEIGVFVGVAVGELVAVAVGVCVGVCVAVGVMVPVGVAVLSAPL
jgi:hypothetical protein